MGADNTDLSPKIGRSITVTRDESFCAVRITMTLDSAGCSSIASGFLWEANEQFYLVTNLHNLTGWNWEKNRAASSKGWLPDTVGVELSFVCQQTEKQKLFRFSQLNFALYDDNGTPLWLVHPVLTEKVDVVALPLGTKNELLASIQDAQDVATRPVNALEWVNFLPAAGDDAVVLGYPKGLFGGSKFPVWKRASIAFEPDVDVDGLPKTMIDTATREGMSGSLVLAIRRGISIPVGGSFGDGFIGESMTPLGVYSGRIGDDELGVQLGIVWKIASVKEIILGGVKGTTPFLERANEA